MHRSLQLFVSDLRLSLFSSVSGCPPHGPYVGSLFPHTIMYSVTGQNSYSYSLPLQSNLVSKYTWGPSELLLTISSTC